MSTAAAIRICTRCGSTKRPDEMKVGSNHQQCQECVNASERARYHRNMQNPVWREKERLRVLAKAARELREHPKRIARRQLKYRLKAHGMTLCQFDEMKIAQGGVCAICDEECTLGGELSIDHCHETGVVRGLLCRNCNVALGNLRDSPEILFSAIEYLKKHGR